MSRGPWKNRRKPRRDQAGEANRYAKLTRELVIDSRNFIRATYPILRYPAGVKDAYEQLFGATLDLSFRVFRKAMYGETWQSVNAESPPLKPRSWTRKAGELPWENRGRMLSGDSGR